MIAAFRTIEEQARFLTAYPKFAAAHQDALSRHCRKETEATGEALRQSASTCERCRQQLLELARLVRLHLPDVYAKLRLVPEPAHWHMQQRFDWAPVVSELRMIESAACRAEQNPQDQHLTDEQVTPFKLAERLGISADSKAREALRKRLEKWRNENKNGGWIEVADPKPRQPRYLYPLRTVWPIVAEMKRSG